MGEARVRDGFSQLDTSRRFFVDHDQWSNHMEIPGWLAFQQFYGDALALGDRLLRFQKGQRPRATPAGRLKRRETRKGHKGVGEAGRGPVSWQVVWPAVSCAVYSGSAFADLHMPGRLPEAELLSQGDVSSKEIMTAVPALMTMLIVAALLRSVSPTRFPTPSRARLLLVGSVSATFLLAAPAAWQLGLTYRPFHPSIPWLFWVIGLSGLWLAPAIGLLSLSLARLNPSPVDFA